jgi:hypothetical protein
MQHRDRPRIRRDRVGPRPNASSSRPDQLEGSAAVGSHRHAANSRRVHTKRFCVNGQRHSAGRFSSASKLLWPPSHRHDRVVMPATLRLGMKGQHTSSLGPFGRRQTIPQSRTVGSRAFLGGRPPSEDVCESGPERRLMHPSRRASAGAAPAVGEAARSGDAPRLPARDTMSRAPSLRPEWPRGPPPQSGARSSVLVQLPWCRRGWPRERH